MKPLTKEQLADLLDKHRAPGVQRGILKAHLDAGGEMPVWAGLPGWLSDLIGRTQRD